jgi:hypothetical protein
MNNVQLFLFCIYILINIYAIYYFLFLKVKNNNLPKLDIKDLFELEGKLKGVNPELIRKDFGKNTQSTEWKSLVQRYIHFGTEEGLLGGPGLLCPDNHMQILRKIDAIDPKALSSDIKDIMDPGRIARRKSRLGLANLIRVGSSRTTINESSCAVSEIDNEDEEGSSEETLFVIDVNIDGVQIFKNSPVGEVIPILATIYSIAGYVIPLDQSKPYIIGVAHGNGKGEIFY